jgi:hypothetical protein
MTNVLQSTLMGISVKAELNKIQKKILNYGIKIKIRNNYFPYKPKT